MTASDPVKRFYSIQAPLYDWTRWAFLFKRKKAVAQLRIKPMEKVLEIGCGTGLNFPLLLHYLDSKEGGTLVGLDFSVDMLRRVNRRIQRNGWGNVTTHHGDATAPLPGGPYDAILFAYSLSMIPDWQTALNRAVEALTPGGRLVVLDFGSFLSWGPVAPLARMWLRWNHVSTQRDIPSYLSSKLTSINEAPFLGCYGFILSGSVPE